ncbi:hypothetical protein [Xylophilus sp.]|uniref:hypothetical protein n=1 Tax=Xylophilus sp. TaxID=2653893 RepID=UPI0013BB47A3|nr:hypothetical protein [Xylophilus sp.]KAF1045631.1 MAG: hypothetical protein GAK38_02923 [Xylophilus sp.]
MNAQMKEPPRAANLSHTLTGFELSKRYTDLLKKFDAMYDYMKLANKTPPCLRLKRADFVDLNALVRSQSQGQRTLGALTYRGLPILSAGE